MYTYIYIYLHIHCFPIPCSKPSELQAISSCARHPSEDDHLDIIGARLQPWKIFVSWDMLGLKNLKAIGNRYAQFPTTSYTVANWDYSKSSQDYGQMNMLPSRYDEQIVWHVIYKLQQWNDLFYTCFIWNLGI